jgi:hypothetical protein
MTWSGGKPAGLKPREWESGAQGAHEVFDLVHCSICLGSSDCCGESQIALHSREAVREVEVEESGIVL